MKLQGLNKIKEKVEDFFPLKTFILSFTFLLLLLVCYIGIHQAFFGKDDSNIQLTGKIMAEVQVENAPPEPITEPPKAEPEHVENVEAPKEQTETINPDALLEGEETAQPVDVAQQPQSVPEALPNPHDQAPTETMAMEDSIAGLSEETSFGSLPIVRTSDGLKSFEAYKTPFIAKGTTKGVISLVMVDYGLSDMLSKSMVETLPSMVTLVASPYSTDLQSKISFAREKSFEIWMNVPMQSDNINMGPNTILAGLNAKENLFRLNAHLGKATGYAGVVLDALTKFPEGSQDLQRITDSISTRGLGIAQLDPDDKMIASPANLSNAPFIQSKLWIDTVITKQSILNALMGAEKLSLEQGIVVVAFRPSHFTASIIQEWQKSLQGKSIQLAPLSYSVKMNLSASATTVKKNEP